MSYAELPPITPSDSDPGLPCGDAERPIAIYMALREVVEWLQGAGAPPEALWELDEWANDLDTVSGDFKRIDWETTDVLMREGMCLYDALRVSGRLRYLDR